jgi:hypothetical protein
VFASNLFGFPLFFCSRSARLLLFVNQSNSQRGEKRSFHALDSASASNEEEESEGKKVKFSLPLSLASKKANKHIAARSEQ